MARGKAVAGTLRLAAPYEFGSHHLGSIACAMLARYPDLRIDIDVEHARVDPLDRRYDIVFSMFDDDLPDSGRIARRIFALARGVYASPALLERYRVPKHPDDLAELPALAAAGDAQWTFTDAKGSSHSVPVRPRMRSSNAAVRRRAAIEGLGVARITSTYCQEEIEHGRLVALLPGYVCAPLRIYALLPGRRLMPPKVRILLEMLSASASGSD
jgi:DNA-binding transcriptional LysR family regulator